MDNNTQTWNVSDVQYSYLPEVSRFLSSYFIWIIFAFGFPGNTISIFVIVRMSRPKLRTSLFFVGLLAVVDNISIILKIVENQVAHGRIYMTESGCQFLYVFGLTLANYANWILVVISIERFTAVMFSLRIMVIWSVKRAMIVISFLLLILFSVHIHMFFTLTTSYDSLRCVYKRQFRVYQTLWFYVSSSTYAFVPAFLMIVFNALTIWKLWKSAKERKNLFVRSDLPSAESRHQERQVTIMLVTLAIVFVLLTIPRCVYALFVFPSAGVEYQTKVFVNVLTQCIGDTNHAVNFYLYFCLVKKFREYCYGLCPYIKNRLHSNTDESTEHTELTNKNGETSLDTVNS